MRKGVANNNSADSQPVPLHSLHSIFVVCCLGFSTLQVSLSVAKHMYWFESNLNGIPEHNFH